MKRYNGPKANADCLYDYEHSLEEFNQRSIYNIMFWSIEYEIY
jgi:hypothetical protein